MALHAQHNTQIHTQSKITKIAKKFLGPFLDFSGIFRVFQGRKKFWKRFRKTEFYNLFLRLANIVLIMEKNTQHISTYP